MLAAKEYIASGKLGNVHMCRVYDQKLWKNIQAKPDSPAPNHLDWNMWNGPAPKHAFNQSMYRCWHHQWRYSGGDIANDASHQIDLARWLLGVKYPKTVYSTGGRYGIQSAAQSPDTQIALYSFYLRQLGYPIVGVIYNVLLKSRLKQRGGETPTQALRRRVGGLTVEGQSRRCRRDQGNPCHPLR